MRSFMVSPLDSNWDSDKSGKVLTTVTAKSPTRRALKEANFMIAWKRLARVELSDHVDALFPLFNYKDPAYLGYWGSNLKSSDALAYAKDETYAYHSINIGVMRNLWRDQNDISQGLNDAWTQARGEFANAATSDKDKGYWSNVQPPLLSMQMATTGTDAMLSKLGIHTSVARAPKSQDKALREMTDDMKKRAGNIVAPLAFGGVALLALYALGAIILLGGLKK